MYSRINLHDLERRDVEGIEPALKAVGYELRPKQMRPSVWMFEPGESNRRHKHEEQEELYYVMDGTATMTVADETFDLTEGDFVVVSPDEWRQISTDDGCTVLAIGAPNVKNDDIH